MSADISSQRVIGAVYELASRQSRWPTLTEIAAYLQCKPDVVADHLNTLKRKRLFRDRQRDRRRVWMPWEQT